MALTAASRKNVSAHFATCRRGGVTFRIVACPLPSSEPAGSTLWSAQDTYEVKMFTENVLDVPPDPQTKMVAPNTVSDTRTLVLQSVAGPYKRGTRCSDMCLLIDFREPCLEGPRHLRVQEEGF
jgi:hypothetical protein